MKIGILSGSVREGRKSTQVAQWVAQAAERRDGIEAELLELADFNLPLLTSAVIPAAANRQYDSAEVSAWSKAIDACDGFVLVTPEYNHGVPGALKNAVDTLGPEWQNKSAALVGYGADGGVRAIEQWRQVLANFNMHVVRSTVALSVFTEFGESGLAPQERRADEIAGLFDQLIESLSLRA